MPDDERKITKGEANYRSHAYSRNCQDCSMFRPAASCTLVGGYIDRLGTCQFWEPKKKGGDK